MTVAPGSRPSARTDPIASAAMCARLSIMTTTGYRRSRRGQAAVTVSGAAGSLDAGRRHVAHRVLGQRGDRQRGIDADVGRDRRAVADEQVLVAEHALVGVDDAALGVGRDHRAAEDVGGRGDVEERLGERALGDAAGALGEPFRRLVGDRDERRDRAARGPVRSAARTSRTGPCAGAARSRCRASASPG